MTPTFTAPPAPLQGTGAVSEWLRRDGTQAVTVLADPALAGQPITEELSRQARRAGLTPRTLTSRGGDLEAVRQLAGRLVPGELVIGVGGGTTLDLAKLATLTVNRPQSLHWITAPQRSGMVALPPELGDCARVLAVPTTLGTGSELGTVACVAFGAAKRLVTGPCLRPAGAVRTAEATDTLPVHLISDGILEALFRTVSAYAGDPADLPAPDRLVEELTVRLVQAGDEVAAHRRAGRAVPGQLRLRIAELSGESQVGWTNLGRSPYAVKAWPIANELSTTLAVAKMRAVAGVWPVLWRRALAGDTRLAAPERITRIWNVVRQQTPGLDPDPAGGLVDLMTAWLIDRAVPATPAQLDATVSRTMRAWGAGLPMLGGTGAQDLRDLLTEATCPPARETHRATGPTDQHRSELQPAR